MTEIPGSATPMPRSRTRTAPPAAGKEAALEVRLWEAVYAFEEMAALLPDLDRLHLTDGLDPAASRRRAAQASEHAARLRAIVQADRPVPAPDPPGRTTGPVMPS